LRVEILEGVNERLFEVRKKLNLTQSQLAEILGTTHSNISHLESGKHLLSQVYLAPLELKLNVNMRYILHGEKPIFHKKKEENKQFIPVIADIPAGPWQQWIDSYAAGAGDDYVAASNVKGSNLFAIRVIGDSMEPLLFEGDILVIDPHKEFTHGLAVVRHNWEYKIRDVEERKARIGYVHRRSERKYYLCPQNKKYDAEEITADNETRIYVPVKVISMRDI